jgi:hypothetical protein
VEFSTPRTPLILPAAARAGCLAWSSRSSDWATLPKPISASRTGVGLTALPVQMQGSCR